MLPVKVSLDRLVMIYKNVTMEEYDDFISLLQANQIFYPKTVVKLGMSSGHSSFRYNLNFGYGEGAIRVDYRHNTLDTTIKKCDMRIEFNPAKLIYQNYEYVRDTGKKLSVQLIEPSKHFFKMLNEHFDKKGLINKLTGESVGHVRVIREFDIAFDFNCPIQNIVVKSLTGKEHSLYKGTHYWGNKHTHGYTKMYDKKKERDRNKEKVLKRIKKNREKGLSTATEEIIIKNDSWVDKYKNVTRIEYTFRMEGNMGVNELNRIKWGAEDEPIKIKDELLISIMDTKVMETFDPTVKAYLLCHLNGLMEFKEMSRRYQEKTKKALQDLAQINLDQILKQDFKKKILSTITNYIRL